MYYRARERVKRVPEQCVWHLETRKHGRKLVLLLWQDRGIGDVKTEETRVQYVCCSNTSDDWNATIHDF